VNVPVTSATALYTLINSAFGEPGFNVGSVTVSTLGSQSVSMDLIEGVNIRDHANTAFENSVSDPTVVSTYFKGGVGSSDPNFGIVRLDRQRLNLPSAFIGDTVTKVTFFGHDLGGNGQPFLAAATLGAQPTPEPASMIALGLGAAALIRRRKSA
jgi:hypothetical protein